MKHGGDPNILNARGDHCWAASRANADQQIVLRQAIEAGKASRDACEAKLAIAFEHLAHRRLDPLLHFLKGQLPSEQRIFLNAHRDAEGRTPLALAVTISWSTATS